jgi:hypothetical protein
MTVAAKLERLARWIPGIAGYQDRERCRDTDQAVRVRLADELQQHRRLLEDAARHLTERRELSPLAKVDRLSARLDELANTLRYAPRGYRGFFDANQQIEKSLEDLYDFDLSLFDDVGKLGALAAGVERAAGESAKLESAMAELSRALEEFDGTVRKRHQLLA